MKLSYIYLNQQYKIEIQLIAKSLPKVAMPCPPALSLVINLHTKGFFPKKLSIISNPFIIDHNFQPRHHRKEQEDLPLSKRLSLKCKMLPVSH